MRTITTTARIGWSWVFLFAVLGSQVSRLAAQAPPQPPDGSPPVTPTVRPTLVNVPDVQRALMAAYPVQLRDAGIGGAPQVWAHIDERGAVIDSRIYESSETEALDAAALEVARVMRFTPARNGDQPVAMWVVIPIRFSVVR